MITKIILLYLIAINLTTLVVYADDKRRAKRGLWRTSEKTLLTLAAVGGSVGALLAMLLVRHKTRHMAFVVGVPVILLLQLALAYLLLER